MCVQRIPECLCLQTKEIVLFLVNRLLHNCAQVGINQRHRAAMKLVKYVQLTNPYDANTLLKALLDIPHSTYTAFTVVGMAKAKVRHSSF